MAKHDRLTVDDAETLALQGLTFLAGEPRRLARFLDLTGISPAELKSWGGNRALQSAVLEHLLGDESLLMVFSAEAQIAPEQVAPAQMLLMESV